MSNITCPQCGNQFEGKDLICPECALKLNDKSQINPNDVKINKTHLVDLPENIEKGTLVFSPDVKRYGYVEIKRGFFSAKHFAVIDNNRDIPHKGPIEIAFSPNSQNVAFTCGDLGEQFLVYNGKTGEKRYKCIHRLAFSPDSMHFVIAAENQKGVFIVMDDIEGDKFYENIHFFTFSRDNKHTAFIIQLDKKLHVIRDNQILDTYDNFKSNICFSPDNKHIAYGVGVKNKEAVVVDGTIGKLYDQVGDIKFTADNKVMYIAFTNDKYVMVIDENESERYDEVSHISQSQDAKHYAYTAGSNIFRKLIINGEVLDVASLIEEEEIRTWLGTKVVFSPINDIIAFCSGVELAGYEIFGPCIYNLKTKKFIKLGVDNGVLYDNQFIFKNSNKFNYLTIDDERIDLVECEFTSF